MGSWVFSFLFQKSTDFRTRHFCSLASKMKPIDWGERFELVKLQQSFTRSRKMLEKLMSYDRTASKSSMHASTEDTQSIVWSYSVMSFSTKTHCFSECLKRFLASHWHICQQNKPARRFTLKQLNCITLCHHLANESDSYLA